MSYNGHSYRDNFKVDLRHTLSAKLLILLSIIVTVAAGARTEKRRRRMRHIWIRNYRCISQCVEQTADRVHRVADPSFGPAVVQHGSLLVGAAAAPGATAASAVPTVGPLGVPVAGRAAAQAAAAAHAAAAAAATAGHGPAGRAGRRVIVVIRAIAVAPGRRAQVGSRGVRERSTPVTGTACPAIGVTGPRVVVAAAGQAARGRGRRGGRRREASTATAAAAASGRRRGQAVVAAATTDHRARNAPRRARPGLGVRVV